MVFTDSKFDMLEHDLEFFYSNRICFTNEPIVSSSLNESLQPLIDVQICKPFDYSLLDLESQFLDCIEPSKNISDENEKYIIKKELNKISKEDIYLRVPKKLCTSPLNTLLHVYDTFSVNETIEQRHLAPGCTYFNKETNFNANTTLLLTEIFKFQLEDGNLEPIFGSLFLYDLHKRRRISETFCFDLNSSKLLNLFKRSNGNQHSSYKDFGSLSNLCLFRISNRYSLCKKTNYLTSHASESMNSLNLKFGLKVSPRSSQIEKLDQNSINESNESEELYVEDFLLNTSNLANKHSNTSTSSDICCKSGIFMIIRVEKVLQQGDISDVVYGYNKEERNRDKLKSIISWCCQRLGRYRMPLAWTAVDLTPYLVRIQENGVKFTTPSMSENSANMKPTESTESLDHLTVHFNKELNKRRNIRSRSIDPGLYNHTNNKNVIGMNVLEDSSISNVTPNKSIINKQLLEIIKTNKSRFSKIYENIDYNSMDCPIYPVELKLENFYKQESDRLSEDELCRCLNEIHRNTLNQLAYNNKGEFASPVHLQTGVLKRFKTLTNISLHMRLKWTNSSNLLHLIKSTDAKVDIHVLDKNTSKCMPLLNPECIPYSGSMFQPFPTHLTNHNRLSPSERELLKLKNDCAFIREMLEFPAPDLFVPFSVYRNLLYIYPQSVSFFASKQASSRNIAVRIQLLYSNGNVTKVLPAVYDKSGSSTLTSDRFTAILYHNRSPEFYEEIKVQLPVQIEKYHCLLFTFYHISCQNKKVESSACLETVIGYSWLPILNEGCLTSVNAHLLVSVDKPTPALIQFKPDIKTISDKINIDSFRWVDGHRELFHVSTQVVSSVSTEDALLECLLNVCSPKQINKTLVNMKHMDHVNQLIDYVNNSSLNELVRFFVPIMDGLIRLLFCSLGMSQSSSITEQQNDVNADKWSSALEYAELNRPSFIALELLLLFVHRIIERFPHWTDKHGRNMLIIHYLTGPGLVSSEDVIGQYFSGQSIFGLPSLLDLIGASKEGQQNQGETIDKLVCELVALYLARAKLVTFQNHKLFFSTMWFLLELLIHVLGQDLMHNRNRCQIADGKFYILEENSSILNNLSLFNSAIIENLITFSTIQEQGQEESTDQTGIFYLANRNFAFFLSDLMTFVPYSFVLNEIGNYWLKLNTSFAKLKTKQSTDYTLRCYQLDLLQIVSSNEFFCNLVNIVPPDCEKIIVKHMTWILRYSNVQSNESPLNQCSVVVPLAKLEPDFYQVNDLSASLLSPECNESSQKWHKFIKYANMHFLITLILNEFKLLIKSRIPKLQSRIVLLIYNLMLNHELNLFNYSPIDISNGDSLPNYNSQFIVFYLPILDIMCDSISQFVELWKRRYSTNQKFQQQQQQQQDEAEPNNGFSENFAQTDNRASKGPRRIRRNTKVTQTARGKSHSTTGLFEIGKSNFLYADNMPNSDADCHGLLCWQTFKRLSLIVVWILKHLPTPIFHKWLHFVDMEKHNQLVLLLFIIIDTFDVEMDQSTCMSLENSEMNLHADLNRTGGFPQKNVRNLLTSGNVKLSSVSNAFQARRKQSFPLSLLQNHCQEQTSKLYSSQQFVVNYLKDKLNFNKSYSFSVNRNSNVWHVSETNEKIECLAKTLVFNDVIIVIANLFDSIIECLWKMNDFRSQPGYHLFAINHYKFNSILPYKKSNISLANNYCLLLSIARILLYSLSLNLCTMSQERILISLRKIITQFPSFVFEENPELCATYCFYLLKLCASKRPSLRNAAVTALYYLTRSYYILTKNISFIQVHLYIAFVALFTKVDSIQLDKFGINYNFDTTNDNHATNDECVENAQQSRSNGAAFSLLLYKHQLLRSIHSLQIFVLSDSTMNSKVESVGQNIHSSKYKSSLFDSETVAIQNTIQCLQLGSNSEDSNLDDICMSDTGFCSQMLHFIHNMTCLIDDACTLQNLKSCIIDDSSPRNSLDVHQIKSSQLSEPSVGVNGLDESGLMMMDVLQSIAHRCRISAELRLYWLFQMMKIHYQFSQFSEAALCLAHCTALVAEHLINRGCFSSISNSMGAFDMAQVVQNLNIFEECCACGQASWKSSENVTCCIPIILNDLPEPFTLLNMSVYFNISGLMTLLFGTTEMFIKAKFAEIVPTLYSRLVSLLELTNNYEQLAEMHERMRDTYIKLKKNQLNKQVFNSYFRVGFYGTLFGSLNGRDFIYKEAPFTKLVEITQRLKTFYEHKFGDEKLVIIKDSNTVKLELLDHDLAYLQITYVEPYLEEFEIRKRKSDFQCNYALQQFVHSVPFTTDGQTHGSLENQYKRKYILKTSRKFPYIKSRLLIVSTNQIELTPIEVALEDVNCRVEQLTRVLIIDPPDVKYLQMILQGCIGPVVNQGPIEVALTFLGQRPSSNSHNLINQSTYKDYQNRLRLTFQNFILKCYEALCQNKTLIGPDQVEYHRALEKNFINVKQVLDPLITTNVCPNQSNNKINNETAINESTVVHDVTRLSY